MFESCLHEVERGLLGLAGRLIANVLKLLGDDPNFQKFDYAVTTYLSNGTLNDVWESIWLDVLTLQRVFMD